MPGVFVVRGRKGIDASGPGVQVFYWRAVMAVVVLYDSGPSAPLPPDVWGKWELSGSIGSPPIILALRIIPFENPQSTWNLLGYACIECERQGARLLGAQTPLSSIVSDLNPSTVLYSVEHRVASNRVDNVRAVHWNINRWVGEFRAIVTNFN